MRPGVHCLSAGLALAVVLATPVGAATACGSASGHACGVDHASACAGADARAAVPAAGPLAIDLTPDESRVLHYVMNAYYNDGKIAFTAKEIRKKTRVELTPAVKGHVLAAVYSEIFKMPLDQADFSVLSGCDACPSAGDIVLPSEAETERMRSDLQQDGKDLVGFDAPDFELRDLDGHKVGLESFQGRPLALAFWSPTCAPSLRALAELDHIRQRYGQRGLAILAVVFSDQEERELRQVVQEEALEIPVLVSRDGRVRLAYQTNLVPTVVLIDREGHMVKRLVGFKEPAVLEAEIAGLF